MYYSILGRCLKGYDNGICFPCFRYSPKPLNRWTFEKAMGHIFGNWSLLILCESDLSMKRNTPPCRLSYCWTVEVELIWVLQVGWTMGCFTTPGTWTMVVSLLYSVLKLFAHVNFLFSCACKRIRHSQLAVWLSPGCVSSSMSYHWICHFIFLFWELKLRLLKVGTVAVTKLLCYFGSLDHRVFSQRCRGTDFRSPLRVTRIAVSVSQMGQLGTFIWNLDGVNINFPEQYFEYFF